MQILIRVTANDIAKGCKSSVSNCPIARAVLRRLKRDFTVMVGSRLTFCSKYGHELFSFEHTPRTAKFVGDFDNGSPMAKPFEFLLEVPSQWGFMFKRS